MNRIISTKKYRLLFYAITYTKKQYKIISFWLRYSLFAPIHLIVNFLGEFARVYNSKELSHVLSLYEILGTAFMSLAPCSPLLFYGINLKIGSWEITQDNAAGIFLASIALLLWITAYFGLHDLTKAPDSKNLPEKEVIYKASRSNDEVSSTQTLWRTRDVVKNRHLLLLLSAEGFLSYQYHQMELEINMVAVEQFDWKILQLGILTAIVISTSTVILFVIQKTLLGNTVNTFFLYIMSFVLITLFESVIQFAISGAFPKNQMLQCVVIYTALAINIIQGYGGTVYCRWLMFSITPSHSSSIIESHRYFIARLLSCLGFFAASYFYDILSFMIPLYSAITYAFIVLLFINRSHFLK